MNIGTNIYTLRKEKKITQEQLAEKFGVSEQAISKWEQGQGYPEVEKLLLLSSKLNVSLDALMSVEANRNAEVRNKNGTGLIVITSPHENVIATCYKVAASGKMRGGKNAPQYALYGVDRCGSNFWGEPTTFLGWYASKELISKEVGEIHNAILKGAQTYTLQFSAKTQRRWASVKIVEE